MSRFTTVVFGFSTLSLLVMSTVRLDGQEQAKGDYHLPSKCFLTVIDEPMLAAGVPGLLIEIAKEGDLVSADSIVAQLDEREAKMRVHVSKLELDVATRQANNTVQIKYSKKKKEVDKADFDVAQEAYNKVTNSVSLTEIRRRRLQYQAAELSIENAENDLAIAKLEERVARGRVEAAEMELERHKVAAQLDGKVAQTFRQVGEWVNAGDPILRIRQLDRLYVEGYVDAAEYSPSDVLGRRCTVVIDMPRGKIESFESKVTFVDDNIETTNEFRVRAEIENNKFANGYLVVPGFPADMILHF